MLVWLWLVWMTLPDIGNNSPGPHPGGLELPSPLWMSLEQRAAHSQGSCQCSTCADCTPPSLPLNLKIEP